MIYYNELFSSKVSFVRYVISISVVELVSHSVSQCVSQYVAANEHQGSMKYQENRDRRKMPTKSRGYITGT